MAQRTIVGIDVGTTKVCTIVAQVHDSGRVNVLGVGLTPSKGLDKGVVVNIDDAVNAIATSVEKAERLSGYRIGTAFVGVSGRHIASLNSRGVVAVGRTDHEITRSDVARAVECGGGCGREWRAGDGGRSGGRRFSVSWADAVSGAWASQ